MSVSTWGLGCCGCCFCCGFVLFAYSFHSIICISTACTLGLRFRVKTQVQLIYRELNLFIYVFLSFLQNTFCYGKNNDIELDCHSLFSSCSATCLWKCIWKIIYSMFPETFYSNRYLWKFLTFYLGKTYFKKLMLLNKEWQESNFILNWEFAFKS